MSVTSTIYSPAEHDIESFRYTITAYCSGYRNLFSQNPSISLKPPAPLRKLNIVRRATRPDNRRLRLRPTSCIAYNKQFSVSFTWLEKTAL